MSSSTDSSEQRIAAHERAKRAKPRGLDETTTLIAVDVKKTRSVADISRHWALAIGPSRSLRLPQFSVPRRVQGLPALDEALTHAAVTLGALQAADFRAFWSTVVTVDVVRGFISSFLAGCPRAWCTSTIDTSVLARPALSGVLSTTRDVVVRILKREESSTTFITPRAHAEYLRALRLTEGPVFIAACALFGPLAPNACDEDNFAIAVRKMLAEEPLISNPLRTDLARIAPAIISTISLDDKPSSSSTDDDKAVQPMDSLLDAVATLASFIRIATSCADIFVRAGLIDRLVQCYGEVSAVAKKQASGADNTAARVLSCIESCAASAIMYGWLGILAGFQPVLNGGGKEDDEKQNEELMKEAAEGFMKFLSTAGKSSEKEGLLVKALDVRCDLSGKLSALAKQYRQFFPMQKVDSVLTLLEGKSEAFPALPVSPVDQLLSLFPGADIAKLQKALNDNNGNVELVVAKICENQINVDSIKEAPVLTAPIEDDEHLVIYRKGEDKIDEEDLNKDGEETEKMKDSILARLAKMEEEEEREQIRRYEAQRLRRSTDGSNPLLTGGYDDDYDDSFDDFVKYNFQDGEGLDEANGECLDEANGEDLDDNESDGVVPRSDTLVNRTPSPASSSSSSSSSSFDRQRGGGGRGRGAGRGGRGGHEGGSGDSNRGGGRGRGWRGKKHHQSDRAMNKRNKGMLPMINS